MEEPASWSHLPARFGDRVRIRPAAETEAAGIGGRGGVVYGITTISELLAWPINDPHLESIRLECLRICQVCPPVPGKDINEEGEKRVAALLAELQHRTHRSGGR